METGRSLILSFIGACMMAMVPCTAFGANLNIGGTVWFAWWNFSLENSIRGTILPHSSLYNRYRMRPTFLYGPTVSVDFAEHFAFSAMFIYTDSYRIHSRTVSSLSPDEFERTTHNITRYDLDTTFSYSPVGYFKVFTGFKFQGYDMSGRAFEGDLDGTGYRKNRISGKDRGLGAGLGIGFTAPLAEGLYFQWNVSGLYLNMRFRYYTDFFKVETAPAMYIPGEVDIRFRYHSWGGNTNASLAYVIQKISSTIILGFRYQVLYNVRYDLDFEERLYNLPFASLVPLHAFNRYMQKKGNDRVYDHFYGISFAFVYSIELTRGPEGETE